jgi:diguanylate cyclase (GGDEF)-like protein/PAS domain S-box-containing protein
MSPQSQPRTHASDDVPVAPSAMGTAGSEGRGQVSEPAEASRTAAGRRTQPAMTRQRTGNRKSAARDGLPNHIVPTWKYMAPVCAGGLVLNAVATRELPGVLPLVLGLLAIAGAALTPFAQRVEQTRLFVPAQRLALMAALVGMPMLLFGLAIAIWVHQSDAVWEQSVGILVILGGIASVILNRRVAPLVLSQAGLWLGVALVSASRGAIFATALGLAVALFVAFRQSRADLAEARAQRERQRAQTRAEEILNDFEQTGQGWFWETDRRGQLVYVSATVGEVLGVKPALLQGRHMAELFQPDVAGEENERTLAFHLNARSAFTDLALRAATREAEERWWSVSGRPLYDAFGNFLGFRGSGHDLTEKRRSEQQVSRLAHYDSLTGLANRLQMAQTLEKILLAPNPEHRASAVFLLDLDRFKQVNDTMGHPAGDALLTQVAQRLERTIGEHGRVGRLGGDEFKVILPGRHRREDLAALARRVIHNLSEPYSIEGHRVTIGASLGIALSPDDGVTSEAIIRNADLALYAAKDGGRGRHHFYAADLHSDAEERRQLEHDLRDALVQGGLELYYQPVVHTVTERITGFEALLRWNHPTRGQLSPAKFIPVAEDSGLVATIGEWALRTACRDLANWPESVRVAVNVSPLQFANPALPAIITSALAEAQVDPARLELEITESVFLSDDDSVDAMFTALKRVGVRLALDDFGTGYSALGYLKKAPFDKIKIDQSFVRGATIEGSRNGAIIASIVNLAEALGMETTAEGVETLDELDLVRMLGCSHVQGFIYEKPLNLIDATTRLQTGLTAIAIGPRAARAARQTMLRKVVLENGGHHYHGTIRNISSSGAMVEGLWSVPPGTIFTIILPEGQMVTATARWSQQDRMGLEFASPLALDDQGRIALLAQPSGDRPRSAALRRDVAA